MKGAADLSAVLGDRYRIERELGGGGMSRVFLAREQGLDRHVVIKVLSADVAAGVSLERFAREIQLVASLQQANIVPLLAAGDAGGVPYFTMPYVNGESLRRRLGEGPRPSTAECMGILRDVARALSYAHAHGVVHRDIKPDNVLLSHGAAVVTDFGIAKAVSAARTLSGHDTLTQAGLALGTPAYMSPEQIAGDPDVDHRADLYAWGCLAYELLVGAPPFVKESPQRVMAAHLSEAPPLIAPRRADVPASLERLVRRCLAKEPSERPSTADEILGELDAVTERRVSGGGRRWWIRAALGVCVVGAAVWLMRIRRSDGAPAPGSTRTIVVMPFDNLGPPSDAFFADGVSEEIASRLAQIPGIRVVGRASVARYRATNRSTEDIARDLGADYVLAGSVRWDRVSGTQAGDAAVRITPALTRARTGERLWGEPVTEKLTDVFKVQADVAERVAAALSVSLAAATRSSVRRADTQNPEAREAVLLGRYLLERRGNANIVQAVALFQQAIARDSMYASAWAGLAEAQAAGPTYGVLGMDSSDRAARRAVALDSLSSEAWTALSTQLESMSHFHEALVAADRAVALDPSSAGAQSRRGMVLLAAGRIAEAETPMRLSMQLDPMVSAYVARMMWVDVALGHADSLEPRLARIRALDPNNPVFMFIASGGLVQFGLLREAIANCTMEPGKDAVCRTLFGALVDPARRKEATVMLDGYAKSDAPTLIRINTFRAAAYAHLGETDRAFAALSRAFEGDRMVFAFINSPWLAPLKTDPRWQTIVVAAQNR